MATGFVKALIILMSINILLYVGGVRVVGSDNTNFISQFVNEDVLDSGSIVVNNSLRSTLPTSFEKSGSGFFEFIDSINAIKNFIFFIVNIVFTPLGLFVSAGLPINLVLIIGLPILLLLIMGVAYFIRSGGG